MIYMQVASSEIERVRKDYHSKSRVNISEAELAPMLDNVKFGARMIDNYKQYWGSPLQDNCTLVAQPEQAIVVPIPGTPHFLKAHLDAIIKNQHDKLLVLEHKTYASRVRLEVLQTIEQFTAYIWILQQLGLGEVAGLAYDGLWKRAEVPKGRTVDDLFWREKITPAQSVIDEYGRELTHIANEMASDPYITHTRTWNGSCFFGCGVEPICAAMSRDEDHEYFINSSDIFMVRPEGVDELAGEVEKEVVAA